MKTYTGTKTLDAKPMSLGDYNDYQGWTIPEDQDPKTEGYLVEYHDGGKANHPDHEGYISWSPKDVFERTYNEVLEPHQQRVVDEKRELDGKITNLVGFQLSDIFKGLDIDEKNRLKGQRDIMVEHSKILGDRIENF
ncbi:MAG: hypothetical protein V3V40_06385 [Nitrosomonadaceae bacterium]